MLLELRKLRAWALPILTKTAHISAPFITTFLLIHLSAPAVASIGGSSLASSTMVRVVFDARDNSVLVDAFAINSSILT